MKEYVLRRLIQGISLVFVVSLFVFSMLHIMPGDPVDLLADRKVSEEKRAEIKAEFGLDKPLHQQYVSWITNALRGDFGKSIKTRLPVAKMFKQRIPVTLKLTGTALLVQLLIALPIGLMAAYRKDKLFDRVAMSLSLFFAAIPSFWVAMLLILFFGVTLRILPINGFTSARHYILPVTAIVLGGTATTIRMTKTEVLDVMHEKFVLTAYAKGMTNKSVLIKHVLRNAMILVVVMVFMNIPWLISGAVIVENIFVIPGMGGLLTSSILIQDFPVVQACVFIITILTVVCNLICDIIIAMLDPRIRISMSGGDR